MAIFIFGDSHAKSNSQNNTDNYLVFSQNSVTMHRVGRDRQDLIFFPNYSIAEKDTVIYMFGEIDCRCHIHRQVFDMGRPYKDVLEKLVESYFQSIRQNRDYYKDLTVIISAVIPPARRFDYESVHGPITHEFPFLGTDEQRVRYTADLNELLREYCRKFGYYYFDGYKHYRRDDQTLRYELSDGTVHISKNLEWLKSLNNFLSGIQQVSSKDTADINNDKKIQTLPQKRETQMCNKPNIGNIKESEKPLISVCMIVKDEEKFLDNCLQSVKDIADEIIIIDTGSKDKTVEIAQHYTDKIYFHEWNNSFSEARNHYFKYAAGEWILQIDADEELVQEDIPILREAVKNNKIDTILIQIVSIFRKGESQGQHSVERVFRNNGKIHYEGRVHNRVVGYKSGKIYPVRIKHYGYDLDDKELTEKKHQRRLELLQKDIDENPDNPLPYHYLSCCYLPLERYDETLKNGLKAIELIEKQGISSEIFLWTRYNIAMAYYKIKEYDRAESMAMSAIARDKRHIDSYYILTIVNFDSNKWEKVLLFGNKHIELCEEMIKNPEKFGTIISNTIDNTWNTYIATGIAYNENDSPQKAEEAFKNAVSLAPKPFAALRAIGIYYHKKHQLSEAFKYLLKAKNIDSKDETVNQILNDIKKQKKSSKTISCCMIVKNEEEFLDNCLKSVKDYVDELIIVDTGSTDSTVEIAKKFTDKVYFHPWENSFSKARNQVLQYASGEWIFQIDADEELMKGSGEKLRNLVQKAGDIDIVYVSIFCSYAGGAKKSLHNAERLFRNNGIIHYEGSVHNRIVGGTKAYYSDIELWHYGYDVDETKAEEKYIRTTTLLKKEIENEPENPLPRHYLSVSYFSRGKLEEAYNESKKAIELSDIQNNPNPVYSWTHFIHSMSCYGLGRYEEAIECSLKAINKYPGHMDSYYVMTIVSSEKGDWADALKYGKLYLKALDKNLKSKSESGLTLNNTMNEGPSVNILLGHACYSTGNLSGMRHYYKEAFKTAENKWEAFWNAGTYHMDKSGDMDLATEYLNLAVKEAPEEQKAWYMLAKLYNMTENTAGEIEALEKIITTGTKDDFLYNRLFALYIENKNNEGALGLINSHGNLTPDLYPDILQLGNSFIEKMQLEEAMQSYMKAAELSPDKPEAWNILAEITYSLGKFDDSQIFLEKAINLKTDDIKNLLTMCELKLKSGDFENHVKYCDMALELLGLPRDITVNGFEDLKNIFIKIGISVQENNTCSFVVNNIIKELDKLIT